MGTAHRVVPRFLIATSAQAPLFASSATTTTTPLLSTTSACPASPPSLTALLVWPMGHAWPADPTAT